jgi:hypothetical protein
LAFIDTLFNRTGHSNSAASTSVFGKKCRWSTPPTFIEKRDPVELTDPVLGYGHAPEKQWLTKLPIE